MGDLELIYDRAQNGKRAMIWLRKSTMALAARTEHNGQIINQKEFSPGQGATAKAWAEKHFTTA